MKKPNDNIHEFSGHQALPEDLQHKIFEAVRVAVFSINSIITPTEDETKRLHLIADRESMKIQQAVAEHFSDLLWKTINRKPRGF